jgi:hypothetical protein
MHWVQIMLLIQSLVGIIYGLLLGNDNIYSITIDGLVHGTLLYYSTECSASSTTKMWYHCNLQKLQLYAGSVQWNSSD